MADVRAFIRKWNGRTLQNDGSVVSKEYKSFQTAFINAMKKIAEGLHGEVVNVSKGHYDVSGFIKRGDKFVYFSYDNGLSMRGRTHIELKGDMTCGCHAPMLVRSADNERDYRGHCNNFTSFEKCELLIERLLAK